jgi:predicted phosphodiesterase
MPELIALSDSHQNAGLLQALREFLALRPRPEAIVHLGDNLADARQIEAWGFPVIAVPGNTCPEIRDPAVPKTREFDFGPCRALIGHRIEDLGAQLAAGAAGEPRLALYGHTHRWRVDLAASGALLVNPGHLCKEEEQGRPASFAVLACAGNDFDISICTLDGAALERRRFRWTPQAWIPAH